MLSFKKLSLRRWWVIAAVVLILIIGAFAGLRVWYGHSLSPISGDAKTVYYTVEKGTSLHQIALGLKQAKLIRSTSAFEYYVRTNELFGSLQAGTYSLNPSMSTQNIVGKIVRGEITTNLLTILPGKRLDQIKQAFTSAGYSEAQINEAFDPATYGGLPALASLPAGATLEGYLYPDSFQKDTSTSANAIVKESLDELDQRLTPDIINGFKSQGLTTFQGITLASIVYRETDDPRYESTVAQVFLSRLKQDMPLGSDVTAYFGAEIAGVPKSVSYDSAFNTRLHTGLPPGPISNFTDDALKAVAHPAGSDYLYFVAGDDSAIHFSHTQAEQDAAAAKYCTKQCAQ